MVILQASERTARAIKRATVFLEGEADKLIDTYEMAIVAYALKLVGSTQAVIILERLETLAANEGMVFFYILLNEELSLLYIKGRGHNLNIVEQRKLETLFPCKD